jgi:hypothetical protein
MHRSEQTSVLDYVFGDQSQVVVIASGRFAYLPLLSWNVRRPRARGVYATEEVSHEQ